ncbi:hypothetical protein Bhyg_04328 [Pseudolycoriella hygida]|uniref:Uncharacterized protein n=1 Tax=Pseudolycoriella hygida TaxID=35572 RepID=A0A9Q0NF79_9DIPT|nr:hypothetical protein Bhyg_04328 [Pseudolycoriella hygida]
MGNPSAEVTKPSSSGLPIKLKEHILNNYHSINKHVPYTSDLIISQIFVETRFHNKMQIIA